MQPWSPPQGPASLVAAPPVKYTRGGALDWGVALSGGGVRSAMFSVGVLKGLYDANLLNHVDVISSVSGGGYASYWLYRSQFRSPAAPFGAAVFHDSVFARTVCVLQARGRFHTYPEIGRNLLRRTNFSGYQRSIQSTFGYEDPPGDDLPLSAAAAMIRSGQAPFFIINATYYKSTAPTLNRGLELTPEYVGSPSRGYLEVGSLSQSAPGWAEAITAAGAAKALLRHPIPNYFEPPGASPDTIWDGGYHENLGALALIRRRIPNIVIVDAEHDPDYRFEGYERLRHLLRGEGVEFSVRAIDEFIGEAQIGAPKRRIDDRPHFGTTPVAEGSARFADGQVSRVYYIKMSIADSLVPVLRAVPPADSVYNRGKEIVDSARVLLRTRRDRYPADRCEALSGHSGLAADSRFVYQIANYAEYIANSKKLRLLRLFGRDWRYDFPHMTTGDQSFYTDQTAALIGLGLLQARGYKWPTSGSGRSSLSDR
jgi:hypothetical protein